MGLFDFKKKKHAEDTVEEQVLQSDADVSESVENREENDLPKEPADKPADKTEVETADGQKEQPKEMADKKKAAGEFILGVVDFFDVQGGEDVLVTGRIYGKAAVGDEVVIRNPGEDEDEPLRVVIKLIKTGPKDSVKEASNADATLLLEKAAAYPFKIGTIVSTEDAPKSEIWNRYITCLGDVYVAGKEMILSDREFEMLSVTDLAQMWRLFAWYNAQQNNGKKVDPGEAALNRVKRDKVAKAICDKLLKLDEIYCVFSRQTGEPYLFSRTIKEGEGYRCMPPDIRIFTKAYKEMEVIDYPEDTYEIRRVLNGEEKKGIYNFLGNTFYIDGACGVEILEEPMAIDAGMLVEKPDFKDVREIDIPVMNPDLVRWTLLIGQLGQAPQGDARIIYNLYYQLMARELVKAKFLVPMQTAEKLPEADESGKALLSRENRISFPVVDGKDGHKAVRVYTDWKRLRLAFDGKWDAMVMTADELIDQFDIAINVAAGKTTGGYVTKAMYTEIKGI